MARRNRSLLTAVRVRRSSHLAVSLLSLLLIAAPTTAFASSARQFGGATGQSTSISPLNITMDVSATKVNDLVVGALMMKGPSACSIASTSGTSFDFTTGSLEIVNARIAGKLRDALGDVITVHGRVSRTTVAGTFLVSSPRTVAGTGPCNSGVVTYVAQSGSAPPGRTAYSGTVGPGWLITFNVSAHATTVNNLVVAYDETCNGPPSDVTPTFRFKSLVISSGEFAGSTSESFGPTVSDTVHIDGTFSGGVAAGQVSDTSRIKGLPTCTQTSPFEATAS